MEEVKILIADDYYLIREGIKKSLSNLPGAVIVGEVNDLADLVPEIAHTQPNVLILEINLCDRPLKQLVEEVKKVSSGTRLLVISDCNCELPILSSIKAGISGFIKKNVSEQELIKAVREIAKGKEYFSHEISTMLMQGYLLKQSGQTSLTEREIQILGYICRGQTNEQMGELLFISEKTIATHKRNIMRKAHVKKTSELILWALDNRIIDRKF